MVDTFGKMDTINPTFEQIYIYEARNKLI